MPRRARETGAVSLENGAVSALDALRGAMRLGAWVARWIALCTGCAAKSCEVACASSVRENNVRVPGSARQGWRESILIGDTRSTSTVSSKDSVQTPAGEGFMEMRLRRVSRWCALASMASCCWLGCASENTPPTDPGHDAGQVDTGADAPADAVGDVANEASSDATEEEGGELDATSDARDASPADGAIEGCENQGCAVCHGAQHTLNCAPPRGVHGESSPTERGVGAHQAHLVGSSDGPGVPSRPVACADCHLVPTMDSLGQSPHQDGVADVSFTSAVSGIQVAGGGSPSFDAATATCSSVYCHAPSTHAGGSNPDPRFDAPGSVTCGACHGLPPAPPHPQSAECDDCHAQVIGPGGAWIDPALHINGEVEVDATCDGCHGGAPDNYVASAPPYDVGTPVGTDATDPQVGAHQAHLAQNSVQMGAVSLTQHRVIACSECHTVPSSMTDPGHIDNDGDGAELHFGALASQGQTEAPHLDKSDPQRPRCSSTYCHAGLCDGSNPNPVWNGGAVEGTCGSCHGLPPTETRGSDGECGGTPGMVHPTGLTLTDCASCHPATMKTTGPGSWEWVNNGECHLNGKVSTATCDN